MRRNPFLILSLVGCLGACGRDGAPVDLETRLSEQHVASAPPQCPAPDFSSFLKVFAADQVTRERFTAPLVRVTDWKDVDDTAQGVHVSSVPKSEYRDFTLRYSDGAFHHASADGNTDPTPLEIQVKPEAKEGGFLVSYVYGLSEGNSWHFEPVEGCWQLTADPEPPAE